MQTKKEFMSSPKLLVVYFLFGLTKGMDEIGETRWIYVDKSSIPITSMVELCR